MTTESQNKRIIRHLKSGNTLTGIDALKLFDTFRLAARISDHKKMGHNVKSEMVIVGINKKKVARYSLNK